MGRSSISRIKSKESQREINVEENIVAIYVETPYQLITSLNIAVNYLHADGCYLFLMEQYYMTDRKFQIESKHDFIRGIYYIQDYVDVGAFKHHVLRIKGIIKGYESKNFPNMCCYYKTKPKKMPFFSAIICNKYEAFMAKQYLEILHRNAQVFVIEDGVGDYVNPVTEIEIDFKRIYYWPNLFTHVFNQEALQAPKVSLIDNMIMSLFFDIFPMKEDEINKIKNTRCIYFHQPRDRKDDPLFTDIQKSELQVINLLKSKFGDSFYIKLHPRDNLNIFPEFQKINSDVPWEAMLYHIERPSDLVLVGLHSTALITAKNTFGLEPYVISTSGLFEYWKQGNSEEFTQRIKQVFEYLRKQYKDNTKVMIPKTMREFSSQLEKINI